MNTVEGEKPYISFLGILGLWVRDFTTAMGRNDRWGRRAGV